MQKFRTVDALQFLDPNVKTVDGTKYAKRFANPVWGRLLRLVRQTTDEDGQVLRPTWHQRAAGPRSKTGRDEAATQVAKLTEMLRLFDHPAMQKAICAARTAFEDALVSFDGNLAPEACMGDRSEIEVDNSSEPGGNAEGVPTPRASLSRPTDAPARQFEEARPSGSISIPDSQEEPFGSEQGGASGGERGLIGGEVPARAGTRDRPRQEPNVASSIQGASSPRAFSISFLCSEADGEPDGEPDGELDDELNGELDGELDGELENLRRASRHGQSRTAKPKKPIASWMRKPAIAQDREAVPAKKRMRL
jgi:hypothetical protein